MTGRREVMVFVTKPDELEESVAYVTDWLKSLEGHPGFEGGSVLTELADELIPNTIVVLMDFETPQDARTLWPKIEKTINPLYPDDKSDKSPEQGAAFFDGTKERHEAGEDLPLRFTHGGGRLAPMFHVHAAVATEFAV